MTWQKWGSKQALEKRKASLVYILVVDVNNTSDLFHVTVLIC
jgi:hypothetical protein